MRRAYADRVNRDTLQQALDAIHYSPEVVEFINTIHRNRLAEIRWLTTWGTDARTSLAPAVVPLDLRPC